MKNVKFLVLALAILTAVALFVSCGGPIETNPESDVPDVTEAPETEAPETEAPKTEVPVTEAPETEAPETEAPETEAPAENSNLVIENGVFKSMTFDFETDLGAWDYFESFDGFSVNPSLAGGKIQNGKWVYDGKCIAITSVYDICNLDKFSVEFDFCFDAFITTTNDASIFTIIFDDNGTLNEKSAFYMALRMSPDGKVFHGSAKSMPFEVELGKTHHYKIEVDKSQGVASVYFDDTLLCKPAYSGSALPYSCFRFLDNNKGAEFWLDNIVITNLSIGQ